MERDFVKVQDSANEAKELLEDYVSGVPSRMDLKDRNEVPEEAVKTEARTISILFFSKDLTRTLPVPDYWVALLEKIKVEEENSRGEIIKERLKKVERVRMCAFHFGADLFAFKASQPIPPWLKHIKMFIG